MLTSLTVKNIVLVESLHLDLNNGLSVLTGETGAGKSILLDALGLVIGGRGDSSLVRNGTDSANVVATFDITNTHPVWDILKSLDIEIDVSEDIILKRIMTADGKSRANINGTAVPIKDLRLVGDSLVDVQGQFDQHGLLNPAHHLNILDNFAGTYSMRIQLQSSYYDWQEKQQQYDQATSDYNKAKDDAQYIAHCLKELESISPKYGEETELLESKSKLQNSDKLLQAYQSSNILLGGDKGADNNIRKTERLLEGISQYAGKEVNTLLSSLTEISEQLQSVLLDLEQNAHDVSTRAYDLQGIEDRLHALKDLARKHRVSVDDLEDFMLDLQKQNSLIQDSDATLSALKLTVEKSQTAYMDIAKDLSEKRHIASVKLSKKVCREIPILGLSGAEFSVNIVSVNTDNTDLNAVGKNGIDTIRFMARMNAGGTHIPIHKSASGGELSRMLLAINVALAETNTAVVLLFDEVDAGVGGKSANAIGGRLQLLSNSHQVFVITHSPQVAGAGHNHLFASKYDVDGATVSTIKYLDTNQRTNEIARMLSGKNISGEAIANAKILLDKSNA